MPNYTKDRSVVSRYRTTGNSWIDGWVSPPTPTTTSFDAVLVRTVNGQTLPNWKGLIRTGGDATTEFSGVYDTMRCSRRGKITQKFSYNFNPAWFHVAELEGHADVINNVDVFFPRQPSQDPTFVDNLARANFYGKLNSMTKAFDGLVFAGELKETLRLLKRPSEQLMRLADKFLDTIQKKKRYRPKSWKKEIGGAWLEQSFGWNPLIADAKNALEAYERITGQGRPHNVVKISAGARKFYELGNQGNYSTPGGKLLDINNSGLVFDVINGITSESVVVRYRAGVIAQTAAPKWHDPSLWGFSPQDFIPSAWELLPWSFLADYVTNIGQILEASCTRGYQTTYVNRTLVRERTIFRTLAINRKENVRIDPGNFTFMYISGDYGPKDSTVTRKEVSRTKIGAVPLPTLQFNWSLSDGQLLNVAALLGTAGGIHPQNTPRRWHR